LDLRPQPQILGDAFGKPGITVDTQVPVTVTAVHRLAARQPSERPGRISVRRLPSCRGTSRPDDAGSTVTG
jgi:hypothetical protein